MHYRNATSTQEENGMTGFVRRVVTGHDANGKAIVISDGFTPVVRLGYTPFVMTTHPSVRFTSIMGLELDLTPMMRVSNVLSGSST